MGLDDRGIEEGWAVDSYQLQLSGGSGCEYTRMSVGRTRTEHAATGASLPSDVDSRCVTSSQAKTTTTLQTRARESRVMQGRDWGGRKTFRWGKGGR